MNRLEEILAAKREEIERLRPRAAELDREARARTDFRDFRSALHRDDEVFAVIAEIKKASPSAGVIAKSFDPVEIAKNYERAGVNAISVLTDSKFFQGSLEHLKNVRTAVSLPLLRKDFIWDRAQIAESAANTADAILLIVAACTQDQLVRLLKNAEEYRLDALVEVHTLDELQRALKAGADLIGINKARKPAKITSGNCGGKRKININVRAAADSFHSLQYSIGDQPPALSCPDW